MNYNQLNNKERSLIDYLINKELLDYFYQNFDCKFFRVAACLYTAKQQGIKTPTLKTFYN